MFPDASRMRWLWEQLLWSNLVCAAQRNLLQCNISCGTLRAPESLWEGRTMSTVVQLSTPRAAAPKQAVTKPLYEIGEIPPLGHVPEKMYAWAIRKERHG